MITALKAALSQNFQPTFDSKIKVVEKGVERFSDLVQCQVDTSPLDPYSKECLATYTELLNGPGKRVRGVLAVVGYELALGLRGSGMPKDQSDIEDTAGILEGVQAMLLGIDDMADNDNFRRGIPTMHFRARAAMAKRKERGDLSLRAYNYSVLNLFVVNNMLPRAFSRLSVGAERREKISVMVGNTMVETARGQGWDMKPIEPKEDVSVERMLQVAEDKTGRYTIESPLEIGAELGEMPEDQRRYIKTYAQKVGQAFQIRDDILGTFGDSAKSGKSNDGDFREGKRTMLIALAHERADKRDRQKLDKAMARVAITPWGKKREFATFKKVLERIGVVDAAHEMVGSLTQEAVDSLPEHWPQASTEFLRDLAIYNMHRQK